MPWSKTRKLNFSSKAPIIRVATVDRQNRPQVTPVSHVVSGGKIYWASDFGAAKLANIKRHPWVSLVADEYRATWKNMGGVMVRGKARTFEEGPLFRKIRNLLYRKFPVYKKNSPFDEGEAVIVEVTPEKLISWWF
jgi:Predicted flavin-nucleotide-binding protein